jgi:uncharacterized protein
VTGDAAFHVHRFDSPVDFTDLTQPFLVEHEAENCFFIGHVPTLPNPTDVHLYAVTHPSGAVAAVALMTPWRHMVMTRAPAEAAISLARYLHAQDIPVPGIQGPRDAVEAFSREWRPLTGVASHSRAEMGIYEATRIIPPASPAPGSMRVAHAGDGALLSRWSVEFGQEIGEPHLARDGPDITGRRIEKGQLVVWEDGGEPVAMAGSAGATPNGIRINAVYTPPPFRRRGYASTLVASLSQQLLHGGRRFCFLYTDLANPTSNKIYRSIGYTPVAESVRVEFDRSAGGR